MKKNRIYKLANYLESTDHDVFLFYLNGKAPEVSAFERKRFLLQFRSFSRYVSGVSRKWFKDRSCELTFTKLVSCRKYA